MMSQELIDLISEEVYRNLVDIGYIKLIPSYKTYHDLPEEIKETFKHIAHNVITVFDDWYDGELDVDDDIDEDEFDDEYNGGKPDSEEEDWPNDMSWIRDY